MAARVQQGRQAAAMEEEKSTNSNLNTRSKRITKDTNKAPAQRAGRKAAAAEDDGEDSQVSIHSPGCHFGLYHTGSGAKVFAVYIYLYLGPFWG